MRGIALARSTLRLMAYLDQLDAGTIIPRLVASETETGRRSERSAFMRSSRPVPSARDGQPAKEIDSIAWLDWPLLVVSSLAGRSFDIRIADRPTVLTLPKEGPPSFGAPSPAPSPSFPTFPPPGLAEPVVGSDSRFVLSLTTPEDAFVVEGVRLRWYDDDFARSITTRANVARFSQQVGDWLSVVREWLEAWSGGRPSSIRREASPLVRLVMSHNPDAGEFRAGGQAPLIVQHMRIFTADELRAAFAAASRGLRLPLEYQLLGDARLSAAHDEHRHAVINACSAAEVGLAQSLRGALARAKRTEKEITATLKVSGVVELYRAHALRRPPLPVSIGEVMSHLAGPRNRAVHEAQALDRAAAYKAIATARDLLDAVSSLPRPRSISRSAVADRSRSG
jgi:hypothetical protein